MTLSLATTFPPAAVRLQQHQVLQPHQMPAPPLHQMVAHDHPPQMPPLTLPFPPYVATQLV